MKLEEVASLWVREKQNTVKTSTLSGYFMMCQRVLIPFFGETEIGDIDGGKVSDFVSARLATCSVKTVRDNLAVLKMLLAFAAEELGQNVPRGKWKIAWPSSNLRGTRIERYSQRQVKAILAYILDNPDNTALGVFIALTTGARIGEICALRFSDVDLNTGLIHIEKTLSRVWDIHTLAQGDTMRSSLLEDTPKTRNSFRDVPVCPKLKRMLKPFCASASPDCYILTGTLRCCEPRVFRARAARLVRAAGVTPVLKFHALRHTFASTLIENKVDPKTVSSILGHANVSITLNLYVHPSDDMKSRAVSKAFQGLM